MTGYTRTPAGLLRYAQFARNFQLVKGGGVSRRCPEDPRCSWCILVAFIEAASIEAASVEAASIEAASIEAASVEAVEAASIEHSDPVAAGASGAGPFSAPANPEMLAL